MTSVKNPLDPSNTVVTKRKKRDLETTMNNLKRLLETNLGKKGTRIKNKPSFLPKKVTPQKKCNRLTDYGEGEFRPDKLKRKCRMEKVVLKPKTELKVVVATNKRKRCIPQKGLKTPPVQDNRSANESSDLITWFQLSSPPHRSLTDLTVEDLMRMDEDSLSDDDLMEILTCPSPVWWEEPPNEFKEGVLGIIEETKLGKTEGKVPTDISYCVNFTNENVGNIDLDMKILKRTKTVSEMKNKAKIAKLENILGNIKRRVKDDNIGHFSNNYRNVQGTFETRKKDDDGANKQKNCKETSMIDANNGARSKKKTIRVPLDKIDKKDDILQDKHNNRAGTNSIGGPDGGSKPRTISSDGSEISWNGEDLLRNLENIEIPIQKDCNTDHAQNKEQVFDNIDAKCKEIDNDNTESLESKKNEIDVIKDTDSCNLKAREDTVNERFEKLTEVNFSSNNIFNVRLNQTPSVCEEVGIKSTSHNFEKQISNLTAEGNVKDIQCKMEIDNTKKYFNKELIAESINETILINDDSNDCIETSKQINVFVDDEDVINLDYEDGIDKGCVSVDTETEHVDFEQNSKDATDTTTSIPNVKNKIGANDENAIIVSKSAQIDGDNNLVGASIMVINNDVSITKNVKTVPITSENSTIKSSDLSITLIKNDIKINKGSIISRITVKPTSESPISIRSLTSESYTECSDGMISDTNIQFIDEYEDKRNEDECLKKSNENRDKKVPDKNDADLFNIHTRADLNEDENSQSIIENFSRSLNNSLDDDNISMEEEYLDSDKNEDNQYSAEEFDEGNSSKTLKNVEEYENINRHQKDNKQYLSEKDNIRLDDIEKIFYANVESDSDHDMLGSDSMEGPENDDPFERKKIESQDTIIDEDEEIQIISADVLFSQRKYVQEAIDKENKSLSLSRNETSGLDELCKENKMLNITEHRRNSLAEVLDEGSTGFKPLVLESDIMSGVDNLNSHSELEERQSLEDTSDQENNVFGIYSDEVHSEDYMLLYVESIVVETETEDRKSLDDVLEQDSNSLGVDADRTSLEEDLNEDSKLTGAETDERQSSGDSLDQHNIILALDTTRNEGSEVLVLESVERRQTTVEANQENVMLGTGNRTDSDKSFKRDLNEESKELELKAQNKRVGNVRDAELEERQSLDEILNHWSKMFDDATSSEEDFDSESSEVDINPTTTGQNKTLGVGGGVINAVNSLECQNNESVSKKSQNNTVNLDTTNTKQGNKLESCSKDMIITLTNADERNKSINLIADKIGADEEKIIEELFEGEDVSLEDKITLNKDVRNDELVTVYQIVGKETGAESSFEDNN